MTPRPPDLGETALSPAEAAYLNYDHDLWTVPKNSAMPVKQTFIRYNESMATLSGGKDDSLPSCHNF